MFADEDGVEVVRMLKAMTSITSYNHVRTTRDVSMVSYGNNRHSGLPRLDCELN